MFRTVYTFILLLALQATTFAQTYRPVCGTSQEDLSIISQRLQQHLADIRHNPPLLEERTIKYVPLTFHLVAKSDGTGRINEKDVYDQLCALNTDYADMEIQFYIKKLNYINNTTVFQTHANAFGFMQFQRDLGSINIWVVEDATPAGDGLGTTLGYFTANFDWLVVRKDEINDDSSTLPHEIGHYFALDHPFNGWDFEPYDPAVHGIPAPAISPGGIATERQDGSNCATAGDFLCDTAPDFNLGFGWPNCTYNGGAKDPMNVIINPDEKLFMGYFLNCPRSEYYFSAQQKQVIQQDLAGRLVLSSGNPRRIVLGMNINTTVINEVPQLVSPIDSALTPGYNAVVLNWNGVTGADSYILQVSRLSNFSILTLEELVYGTSQVVTGLQSDKLYFWRVRPQNNHYACAPFTPTEAFRTSTTVGANDISSVNDWAVMPNPTTGQTDLFVRLQVNAPFEGRLMLFNATGQIVQQQAAQRFEAGEQNMQIPIGNLQAGVYIVSLQTQEGRLNKRIVVTE